MKRLHEIKEMRWEFKALAIMDGVIRKPSDPKNLILLLHGLNERGRRIYRKLLPYLPEDSIIIAPNAPFPLPRTKEHRIDYGYTWYFYDRFERSYHINQDLAKSWIEELLHLNNPQDLPVTIIGFSQGGYLAPLVGKEIPQTELVIGIGCEFRHNLMGSAPLNFKLEAIHGANDQTIHPQNALSEIEELRKHQIECGWHLIEETAHEITPAVGVKIKQLLEEYGKNRL